MTKYSVYSPKWILKPYSIVYSTSVCLLHLDMYGKGYISKKYIYLGSQENREVGHPNFQNTV